MMNTNRPRIQTKALPLTFINSVVSEPVPINIPYRVSTIKTKSLIYRDTIAYSSKINQIQSTGAVYIVSVLNPPLYLKGKSIFISGCSSAFGSNLNDKFWTIQLVGLNYISIAYIDANIGIEIETTGLAVLGTPEEYCYLTSSLVSHNPLGVYFTDFKYASYSNQDDVIFKSQMPMDITGSYTFENKLIDGSPYALVGTALLLLEFTEAHETALSPV
jgi:hypothetical protein